MQQLAFERFTTESKLGLLAQCGEMEGEPDSRAGPERQNRVD